MADFSKQWCEFNDPEMPSDFDILEEANKLEPNNYIPMICEGYGFIAIGKNEHDDIMLAFRDNKDNIKWENYNNVIK
ncbi:hypothetical protein UFOVP331_66 [uncultured Caudovirales phage]|jgi:hypothetical protein|uniref:Uncharacterized protein n=1 Tax=uncultured Caudovirales phage TaxID=2100421 RepID=A0A6J5M039_9CAUD|nr:hypothetical protein UFOVP331_66 [uncultured Caudovirales phage]